MPSVRIACYGQSTSGRAGSGVDTRPIAVLGTGMAGLGAGNALVSSGVQFVCFDCNSYFGGHTYSFRYPNGFVFDEGGHISFTKSDHVREILASNVDGSYEEPQLKIDNYWKGRRITHPVQCNLKGLPVDLVVDIIKDFVEVDGTPITPQPDYATWLVRAYGRTFAETFPMAYGRKYHTVEMDALTTDWIGPRMYRPTLEEVVQGALAGQRESVHYVDTFRYPSEGGFLSYLEPFAEQFDIRLDHRVVGIDTSERIVRFANGRREPYKEVISSIPLPELVPLVDGVPDDVRDAARRLAFTTAVLVNLGIDRPDLSETHITYFYDEDILFSRVNLPYKFAPKNAPPGTGSIQAEVYFSDKYRPLNQPPETLAEPVIRDLKRCGFIREDDTILLCDVVVNRYANVIFDHDRQPALAMVHGFLDQVGIRYCGRYGNWGHEWTDEAFLSGEETAQRALGSR